MDPAGEIDLFAPLERDTILEIRTSKMKTMPGLTIQSGIDKELRNGKIPVTFLGLDADEHDLTFHGGGDKAIHGYCSSHYPQWAREYPEAASRFKPGGFGENLVMAHMNERNVCIGDVYSVGEDGGVVLQVSLPRQPCFKLNHRFGIKGFAPQTYGKSRTGWYFRVLGEGAVQAGDEIRLVERRWPKWTVERVQEYLHRNVDCEEANEELAGVSDLGDESRDMFRKRVVKMRARRRKGEMEMEKEIWKGFRVVEKRRLTRRVVSFVLEALTTPGSDAKNEEEDVKAGSHARIMLPNGLIRSYSIVSGRANRFELGVALEESGRGGSVHLHRVTKVGDVLRVGRITTVVKPASAASNHVFIVGGIGITAFLSLMEMYRDINWETTLHYGVRSLDEIPFAERLDALREKVKVVVYDGNQGQRMDIPGIFRGLSWNSNVYVCGPRRMLEEAKMEAKKVGLGEDEVHFEAFSADITGDPFEAVVANREGKVVKVEGEETLLDVLRREFDGVPSSCEVGNCGTCKVALKSGVVEHKGSALMEEEKKEGMLSCVSRGVGRITIDI